MPDWQATMISADEEFDGAPLLRGEFTLETGHGEVSSATLHLSALGVVEAWVNDRPVSAELLTPGWTSYEWRIRYRTHDVTEQVLAGGDGPLVIGLALGNGWYRGRLGWSGGRNIYGEQLGGWVQLELTYADGHTAVVTTDTEHWTAGPSAVTANDLYDGEDIDARRRVDGWRAPGFAGDGWTGVHALDLDPVMLEPYVGPPVVRTEERAPQRIWTSPAGKVLVDFGQNLVGWLRVRARGEAGAVITLRHAEVLEHDELGTRPLRTARATDHLTLSGGEDVFEPTFTFHGFRYAEVDGWPGGIDALQADPDALTAVVIGSDLRRTGRFASSHDLLNQFHANVVWGMRGNFVDVPTDCPQRDERLGWTGDIAAFAPSAVYLYDASAFLRDWLRDVAQEAAHADGMVPFVIPDVLKYSPRHVDGTGEPQETTCLWSDAAVWVPWSAWQAYGDLGALGEAYPTMAAHTRRERAQLSANGVWDTGFQFGDWLDPGAPPDDPFKARADIGVVATACAYRTAVLTAAAARLLGHDEDAGEFETQAADLRAAFTREYVDRDGQVVHSDCQTVYALAIVFGLLDEDHQRAAGDRLAALAVESGFRISTGFAGTPFVTDALTLTGHLDEAYGLLLEEGCPSWLYPVTMGATTVWERWDSMLPDGTINPGQMTSFNHYALGAVADWMHRVVGGLAPAEPGYASLLIAPQPGGGLTWAETSLETPHGEAAVHWELDGDRLTVEATVPAGTTATLRLPGREDQTLDPGRHTVTA